ncbi:hypothetical protein RCL_jg16234.t1 [Rhizophagus clarus]|uniref:Uncharacterized protein n=1 Tax=Rhizophagus clarus TaxID=94130 RepID=A0A8H3MID3_9GLOM|nr:hypothetical protein RCL_jg16234.t1 [Rhizophagus clarus]
MNIFFSQVIDTYKYGNFFWSILDLFDKEASNFDNSIYNGVDNLLCEDFNLIELKSSKTILTKWLFNWKNPPKQFSKSNYLFDFLLLPLDLFVNLLIYSNFEKPEHPTYSSMERKNNLHRQPFEMLYEEIDENMVLNSLKNISKSVTKKVDAAISYSPFESEDEGVKLYFFLCEAKKPNTPDELEIKDYDKLKVKEAPYMIEMLWIIKKLIKETYGVVQDIEREIKTIRN